ncbi:MAG: tRNA (adenosine(37)-N6)-threonylcarbamoyltransferase complex ATPase subunit type 1 TsaE [Candidatus Geothermincolia bacterium]
MELVLKSGSSGQSARVGSFLAEFLCAGDLVCLEGDLGTGKTVLVQGLARGRGYAGPVPSPTFTIINPYPEIGLCHVDAFRLSGPEELLEAGIEEYLDGEWICAVEWAEKVRGALPPEALELRIEFGDAEDDRLLRVAARGGWNGRAEEIIAGLKRYA